MLVEEFASITVGTVCAVGSWWSPGLSNGASFLLYLFVLLVSQNGSQKPLFPQATRCHEMGEAFAGANSPVLINTKTPRL